MSQHYDVQQNLLFEDVVSISRFKAPLDNTIEDFWRMVFQEGCPNVVNLTRTIEDGKIKSTQYWPLEAGAFVRFGKMFVNTKKV
ncbi:hypothetical protein TELCIR_17093 [Teladorsagia circumcincta]|uniref:Tyrosine-protein phosphatase domain-containing protein n=1 Tax=Teladorsagia circumcincta TaxID=45464 RepID=A0A2G9TTS8_TELCI|nr:hypothetical protein TELCIR_17093 [Teladorsagia circumcincta]